jgi:NAD(P)H dehydrogenase (quinone)
MAKIAIIYYSLTGKTFQVAQAAEQGARAAGATTRLCKVRELLPYDDLAARPAQLRHFEATQHVPEATLDDLEWAEGYVFGTPTRFGGMAAQLKHFLDGAGGLWAQGKLANKPVGAFTGAGNPHGGQESTLLAVYQMMCHWGAIIVPPGYTDEVVYAAGGNPYGVSFTDADGEGLPVAPEVLEAARYLGGRVAHCAAALLALQASSAANGLDVLNDPPAAAALANEPESV